ncbi:MAG TPA: nucleotide exchange factor GrpE [Lacisediminihabitans sp.]|jgi:molecular chaperone GrpE|nr:nucleotide exchange factor GrpE [Lacisediminihabitans sp.]HXD62301.1 nucleotide exchange factor GrpE [Lacisediminihabitans sp.]
MADKKKPDDFDPKSGAGAPGSGEPSPTDAESLGEEIIEAEGPDVETSLTDADLEFLKNGVESDLAAERLADLQRLQAEYVNYRKRVERDREANRDLVIAEVVAGLFPALDDLRLAEIHGDLEEGPMTIIAQKLRAGLDKFGLTMVGEKGEEFDPHIHEALMQLPSPDVTTQVVADVIQPGYKLGDRLLRAAKVAVSVPAEK